VQEIEITDEKYVELGDGTLKLDGIKVVFKDTERRFLRRPIYQIGVDYENGDAYYLNYDSEQKRDGYYIKIVQRMKGIV
jgi:hypothetical protein